MNNSQVKPNADDIITKPNIVPKNTPAVSSPVLTSREICKTSQNQKHLQMNVINTPAVSSQFHTSRNYCKTSQNQKYLQMDVKSCHNDTDINTINTNAYNTIIRDIEKNVTNNLPPKPASSNNNIIVSIYNPEMFKSTISSRDEKNLRSRTSLISVDDILKKPKLGTKFFIFIFNKHMSYLAYEFFIQLVNF